MSAKTATAASSNPLRRFGAWWDTVVDSYDGLGKPAKIGLITLFALFFYALPLLRPPVITTDRIDFGGVMFSSAAFALVALGLNIVIGYAGLLDLGYVGFYAVGAYTTGVLTAQHWHWPFFLVLPIAIAVTMVTGVILGAPTLRVRGDYLAIVTLGFGEIIRLIVTNVEWLGAAGGIKNIPHPNNIGPAPKPPFDRAASSTSRGCSGTASSPRSTTRRCTRPISSSSARSTRCRTTGWCSPRSSW